MKIDKTSQQTIVDSLENIAKTRTAAARLCLEIIYHKLHYCDSGVNDDLMYVYKNWKKIISDQKEKNENY